MKECEAIINAQTARINWPELARYFSRGNVICVAPGNDLVGIAAGLVSDDRATVEQLIAAGMLSAASDSDAIRWNKENATFWSVVIAPWVVVQEVQAGADSA